MIRRGLRARSETDHLEFLNGRPRTGCSGCSRRIPPAIDARSLLEHIADHLRSGGSSVLLGETRDEYVARSMSTERRSTETASWFREVAASARKSAGGTALVAVDQELGGIQRLHDLATPLPTASAAATLSTSSLLAAAAQLATECSGLGVNVVLSPIVDIVTGPNPWLDGRPCQRP